MIQNFSYMYYHSIKTKKQKQKKKKKILSIVDSNQQISTKIL